VIARGALQTALKLLSTEMKMQLVRADGSRSATAPEKELQNENTENRAKNKFCEYSSRSKLFGQHKIKHLKQRQVKKHYKNHKNQTFACPDSFPLLSKFKKYEKSN
jgi:hypothetical protein